MCISLPHLSGAEASKVVEGIDEDKITAEIEDLQHKLGDLQSNIDKVLQEVSDVLYQARRVCMGLMGHFPTGSKQEEKEKCRTGKSF